MSCKAVELMNALGALPGLTDVDAIDCDAGTVKVGDQEIKINKLPE